MYDFLATNSLPYAYLTIHTKTFTSLPLAHNMKATLVVCIVERRLGVLFKDYGSEVDIPINRKFKAGGIK